MVKTLCDTRSLHRTVTIKERSELLPEDHAGKLFDELKKLMAVQKYYINPFISVEDVALKLNVHRNVISYVVSHCSGMHFRDFLNEFRLLEVDQQLDQKNSRKLNGTESTIVERAGFFSMSTYYRAKRKRAQRSNRRVDYSYNNHDAKEPA
jgi:AraC-like DNA-binding protein